MDKEHVSIVESEHEEKVRLAQASAAAAQALFEKQHAAEIHKKRIQKISLIVSISVISFAVLGALIWLVISLLSSVPSSSSPSNQDNSDNNSSGLGDLAAIEGYSCTTTNCLKITDLTDHSLLVRDDSAYFIRDRIANTSVRTAIKEQEYRAITPFVWGSELLVSLDPNTGRSAIYSITRNRQIGTFSYDTFLSNSADPAYANMTWIIGKYILATQGSETRLLDIFDGKEIVRATNKIFAYSPFFFGYETSGERRAYIDSGTRVISTTPSEFLYIKDSYLIHIKNKTTMTIYDSSGAKLRASTNVHKALLQRLRDAKSKDYATTLATFSDIFIVPN